MSRTKKLLSLMLAVLLAAIIMVMPATQVIASAKTASGNNTDSNAQGKYISEVRVGLGKSVSEAAASLAGYTILTDEDGKYADLNEGAESKSIIGSKGSKVVLLGYKTTNDPADAITDLAVMNMDGGYSVKDYEVLMDKYLETQIKPLVEGFIAAIQEYRANYTSSNPANQKRAQYAHDLLNLLWDDDCYMRVGDLLLNETKWEIGDEAYDAFTITEQRRHADIVTIFMQANGKATLTIQNLLARAADTADTTWIERFVNADAEALMNEYFPTMAPTDAEAMMSNIFGDDARKILSMWDGMKSDLDKYDEAVEFIENYDMERLDEVIDTIEDFDADTATKEQEGKALVASMDLEALNTQLDYYRQIIAVHDFLESVEYFDEFTLLDYFSQTKAEAASDMMTLYALVSSLSAGQRGGLDFVSLNDLIMMAVTDAEDYSTTDRGDLETASIYEGVDRAIYEKGAVALTSEALRKGADAMDSVDDYPFSTLTTVMWGVSALSIGAAVASWTKFAKDFTKFSRCSQRLTDLKTKISPELWEKHVANYGNAGEEFWSRYDLIKEYGAETGEAIDEACSAQFGYGRHLTKSAYSGALSVGLTVVMVALTAYTVWSTYQELCDYYDVEFSPIPNYMVDEADITRKNENNEVFVIKNQTAYYKAVECNRTEKDDKFDEIGNKADLNGDVGRKWVALYSVKNAAQYPILADSFKVVTGSSNVPLDYSTGIHKFGSGAAFDMNNTYYAWNHGKGGIYVYYKVDDTVPPREGAVTGTIQTAGTLAAVGGGGLLVGFLAGSLVMNKRKKEEEADTAA